MSEPMILYAIVFTDENGREWVDSTCNDGEVVNNMYGKFALSANTDVYVMRKNAETMASNRTKVFRIIKVEEIIKPVVVGYREIDGE